MRARAGGGPAARATRDRFRPTPAGKVATCGLEPLPQAAADGTESGKGAMRGFAQNNVGRALGCEEAREPGGDEESVFEMGR